MCALCLEPRVNICREYTVGDAGATVIVHGRSIEKSEKAADAVRAAGGKNATVHALAADLASLKQARFWKKDPRWTCQVLSIKLESRALTCIARGIA